VHETFTPVRIGRYTVPNRLVMAPMTRSRAKPDGTPADIAAEYYAQRASVGLIVTEDTQPSDDGQGYLATPREATPTIQSLAAPYPVKTRGVCLSASKNPALNKQVLPNRQFFRLRTIGD
jgi:hypothetical protein